MESALNFQLYRLKNPEEIHCHMDCADFLCCLTFQVLYKEGEAVYSIKTNETFTVTSEYISSQLLLKLKKMAEEYLGLPVSKAVISVPAEFDERQRNYTVKAANLAGM